MKGEKKSSSYIIGSGIDNPTTGIVRVMHRWGKLALSSSFYGMRQIPKSQVLPTSTMHVSTVPVSVMISSLHMRLGRQMCVVITDKGKVINQPAVGINVCEIVFKRRDTEDKINTT